MTSSFIQWAFDWFTWTCGSPIGPHWAFTISAKPESRLYRHRQPIWPLEQGAVPSHKQMPLMQPLNFSKDILYRLCQTTTPHRSWTTNLHALDKPLLLDIWSHHKSQKHAACFWMKRLLDLNIKTFTSDRTSLHPGLDRIKNCMCVWTTAHNQTLTAWVYQQSSYQFMYCH